MADVSNVDPYSGRPADQALLRSLGRARPGGSFRHDAAEALASHRRATIVAGGIFALTVLALVGLWSRAGTGAVGSSSIVPSSVIAFLALAAIASTYRLGHHARPALVRSSPPVSSAATLSALSRANAAHMAGVSHIRIIEGSGDAGVDAVGAGVLHHGSPFDRTAS